MLRKPAAIVCFFAVAAHAQVPGKRAAGPPDREIRLGEDELGCKDSALLSRFPGCAIIQCDRRDTGSVEMQIGVSQDGAVRKESMDGLSEVIYYLCPPKASPNNIVKTLENALIKNGFKVAYAGKDDEDMPLVTTLKDTQWIQVSTYLYNENTAYIQTSINVPPENEANAEAIAEEIGKTGRAVVHGLTFDANGDLTGDPEKVLADVAASLVRQPNWKIRVEGHTGAAGDAKELMLLSQKQASAVGTWLLEHGIDKARVTILGCGDTKPVSDNLTEDGRAKNRRIELVRF